MRQVFITAAGGPDKLQLRGMAEGWLRPHVDRRFSLAQAGEAQAWRKRAGTSATWS